MSYSSPIIKSKRANFLDIIGIDCYNIINDYKNEMETYEKQINNIQKCIKNKSRETYIIDMKLKHFLEYYKKTKMTIKLEYNIIISKNEYEINYFQYKLDETFIDLLNVEKIYYTKTSGKDMITLVLKTYIPEENDYIFKKLISKTLELKK